MFCFAETSCAQISAGPAAQPSRTPGRKRLRRRPRLDDGVRRERPEARQRVVAEGRARGRRRPRRSGSRTAARARRAPHAGRPKATRPRVLVVRDRVEELRPQPAVEHAARARRPGARPRPSAPRRCSASKPRNAMIAPRYVGRLDHDGVAAVEERLADELERLDPAARDQQLVVVRPPPLHRLEPARRPRRASRPARASACTGRRSPRPSPRTPRAAAAARSRGNVSGSGKPPANEIRSGRPRNPSTNAIPSPTSPRVRSAKSRSQRPVSGVTAM